MLEKPSFGWTKVSVSGIQIGVASYIEDVPLICLDTFISYFSNQIGNFIIEFDGEGTEFGLVEFCASLCALETVGDKIEIREIDASASAAALLFQLGNKLVRDIEKNLDDWVKWNDFESDPEHRKHMLTEKCKMLKEIIREKEKERKR